MNYQMTPKDRLSFGSLELRFIKVADGYYHFKNENNPEQDEVYSEKEMKYLTERKDFRFEANYYCKEAKKAREFNLEKQIASFDTKAAQRVMLRYLLSAAIDALKNEKRLVMTDQSLRDNKDAILGRAIELGTKFRLQIEIDQLTKTVSPRTLRTYYGVFKKTGCNALGLGDGRQALHLRKGYFDTDTEDFLQQCAKKYIAFQGPDKNTVVVDTIRAFKDENKRRDTHSLPLLTIPSRSTIYARVNAFDNFHVDCVRLGIDKARAKYASSYNGLSVLMPLERVEIDEWKVDLITLFQKLGLWETLTPKQRMQIPRGRRLIVVAIDAATRVILGFVLTENPSTEATKRLLFQVLQNKTDLARAIGARSSWEQHGTPMTVACDTGSAFISDETVRALTYLGIMVEFGPAGVPEMRSRMERFFGSLTGGLMPRLIGRTFASVEERQASIGEDLVALTDEDLTSILVTWIVDYYHHKPHAGLQGQTPANAWKEGVKTFGLRPPQGWEQITMALGIEYTRIVSKRGLQLYHLHYSCEELPKVRKSTDQREFKFRVHPENIGFAMIWINDRWVRADSIEPHTEGVRMMDWIAEYRALAQKYHKEAEIYSDVRDGALKRIGKIVDMAKARAQLAPVELSPERLERLDRELYHGPRFIEDTPLKTLTDVDIPFGEVIDTDADVIDETNEAVSTISPEIDAPKFNADKWRLE